MTAIETSVGTLTVSVVEPVTPLKVAEIDVAPTPALDARPFEPTALLMLALVGSLDAQVAVVVNGCVDVSV